MNPLKLRRLAFAGAMLLVAIALLGTVVFAQNVKVQGLIKGRNGDTMILQTSDSPKLIVLPTDTSHAGRGARRIQSPQKANVDGRACPRSCLKDGCW